ncbi:MAG: serine hydrolase [Janthinobacterium lividum]
MAAPVHAQGTEPTLADRGGQLVTLLAGQDVPDYLAPSFTAQVGPAQLAAVTAQLRDALGDPTGIVATKADTAWAATLTVGYARGTATVRLALDPASPHRVIGLLVTGTARTGDTAAALTTDVAALPGEAGFGIWELGTQAGRHGPRLIAGVHETVVAPLGSAFKLWLLAEASRQVGAGKRHWSDVVPLGPPSLPSGITQSWPAATPMTLQSLATLAIAISDNTAADTLLATLGRERVEAMVRAGGAAEPDRTLPLLSTREAFVLKGDPALTARWAAADVAGRRRLLAAEASRIAAAPLSAALFADKPVATDAVEWFASPADMARLLDWLRLHADAPARAILATNPGTDDATRAPFGYLGYKGGSEPGVLSMNWLVRTKDGRWLAVAGHWHRADAAVPTLTFATLMNRALALAAAS